MPINQLPRIRFLRRRKILRRYFIAVCGIAMIAAVYVGRPLLHVVQTILRDVDGRIPLAAGIVDDASRMNATEVHEIWPVPADVASAEEQLAQLLQRDRHVDVPVSIAGARHSMGGHCIAPGGIVIDMTTFNAMELDESQTRLLVQAGATWADIIPYLDKRGRSPASLIRSPVVIAGLIIRIRHSARSGRGRSCFSLQATVRTMQQTTVLCVHDFD